VADQTATVPSNIANKVSRGRLPLEANLGTSGALQFFREQAGILRSDGASKQPRLHDLRHTFAVHRLTSWYRQGCDVQALLPVLSTYMGHVHIRHTQVYLSMTPELLHEANTSFEHYVEEEDLHD
jgi:integrase